VGACPHGDILAEVLSLHIRFIAFPFFNLLPAPRLKELTPANNMAVVLRNQKVPVVVCTFRNFRFSVIVFTLQS